MQTCPRLGQAISLGRLLGEAAVSGAHKLNVKGCTCDSRQVQPGWLFAALRGRRWHGARFVAEAERRGAVAVLSEAPAPQTSLPVCLVPDARAAYGRICQRLAGEPSHELRVVGVTGTNGKTTTSCLIASILLAADMKVGLAGTLGYADGEMVEQPTLTTPPADKLAALLRRMVEHDCTHAVLEVSSHALDQQRVTGIRFDAACLTNIERDHLDYHPSLDHYQQTKARLFDHLAPEGLAVVNADDPFSDTLLRRLDGPALTVAIDSPAELTAVPLECSVGEQIFLLRAGSETIPVRTRIIGTHHIYNCLLAAGVGLGYGIELAVVVRGLEAVDYVPGRLERIECGQPFSVFVDYAHTPDALARVLTTLRAVTSGRLICVFGAGGDRDQGKRPHMGAAVEQYADLAVLTSDNPRSEDPAQIAHDILAGCKHHDRTVTILDRAEAIYWALEQAAPGDCVLVAGKGHETHQIIGRQRIAFDDRELVRQWLYDVQPYSTGSLAGM